MLGFLNGDNLIIGFDLGNESSQISFSGEDGEVSSLSNVAGAEEYDIPTVLCKRSGVNQWFYGKEAIRYAKEQEGILVTDLVKIAKDGEMRQIDGASYDPVALLTLFVRRCLGLLPPSVSLDKVSGFMFTCETLDSRLIEVLGQVAGGLKLKPEKVFFQSYTESFYNYMIRQSVELWNFQVLLFDYYESGMRVYRMECNKRTKPIVAFIDAVDYPFPSYDPMPETEKLRSEKMDRLDNALLEVARSACQNNLISSVYLVGEHFSEEWMKESLKFLCRGRRVFQGSNLYCKGACYGMMERLAPSEYGQTHVFLGNDKLKANIGLRVSRRGEPSYFALLDAGVNWFEAEQVMECYAQGDNVLELTITPLIAKGARNEQLVLEDMPGGIRRLRLHASMEDETKLLLEVEDLGLGEISAPCGHIWKKEIALYET